MNGLGSCSSFSVATTVFVSLAICAVISYGVFYYFKQRLAIIEKSQMEQARIMQAIISRGLAAQQSMQSTQSGQNPSQKEITITQSSLIEVSSDDDDESPKQDSDTESVSQSDSDSDESSSSNSSNSSDSAKWSIGDEIHQADGYHEEFTESFKKNIMIDAICIDSGYVVDSVTIENAKANTDNANNANNANNASNANNAIEDQQQKKIISLNRGALSAHNDDEDDADEDDDENDSSSSEDQEQEQEQGQEQGQEQDQDQVQEHKDFELKIGNKPSATSNKTMQLNYGNMSVSALRQLAKERGLGGDDGDLQKLKKKDLVQLLQ